VHGQPIETHGRVTYILFRTRSPSKASPTCSASSCPPGISCSKSSSRTWSEGARTGQEEGALLKRAKSALRPLSRGCMWTGCDSGKRCMDAGVCRPLLGVQRTPCSSMSACSFCPPHCALCVAVCVCACITRDQCKICGVHLGSHPRAVRRLVESWYAQAGAVQCVGQDLQGAWPARCGVQGSAFRVRGLPGVVCLAVHSGRGTSLSVLCHHTPVQARVCMSKVEGA